jgi:hypothetical protein
MECKKTEHTKQIPYHQLMTNGTHEIETGKGNPLNRTVNRDYLSRRQEALNVLCRLKEQEASKHATDGKKTATDLKDDPWTGASSLEKALISCCTIGESPAGADLEAETDVEEDTWIAGALRETRILEFIGLMAMRCQDLASRSLALAVLERTHQLDERIQENFETTRIALASQSMDAPGRLAKTEDTPSLSKRPRISEDDRATTLQDSHVMVNPKPTPQRRLMLVLGAKGLQILSRWVLEASEPVIRDVPMNGTKEVRSEVRPSPTGLLLLPLLEFLEDIPFNKQAIVQSKINKVIKKLSKHVDFLVSGAQAKGRVKLEKWTHVDAGGLPVIAVQSALNNIKLNWERKAKENGKENNVTTTFETPLGRLNNLLRERLDDLQKLESGEIDKPTWLAEVEQEERKASQIPDTNNAQIRPKSATAEEKARRERENERHHMMRKDLEKARQEKLKLLKKLREMKRPSEIQEPARPTSRRGVKWLDGLPASSKQRKRDVLESVFVFDNEHVKLVEYKIDTTIDNQEVS